MNAEIEPKRLLKTLSIAGQLVEECKIHLLEDGIKIRAVDPANVGMVDLELNKPGFESYSMTSEEAVIGTNLGPVVDTARMASGDNPLQLRLDSETRKLHVEVDNMERTIALIDPDSLRQEPDIPELDLPAELVAEGSDINRGVKAADMVGDHVTFDVDERDRLFTMSAQGDTDDVNLELEEDDLIDMTPGVAKSIFSLDYLKDMMKSIPDAAEVHLDLGEEFPIMMEFDFADANGTATYILAPRIQSD